MLVFRDACVDDLVAIVELYADDDWGSTREVVSDPVEDAYLEAFRQIDGDPRHRLVVVEDDGELVATLQLSFLPYLVLRGGQRAQIESVRVRSDRRGSDLGEAVEYPALASPGAGGQRAGATRLRRDRRGARCPAARHAPRSRAARR